MIFKNAFFALAVAILPVFAHAQDLRKDEKMGNQGLKLVEQQMGFYQFESAQNLINRLGQRLVKQLETPLFKYEFYLVDSPEPNAFALPGGKIFVTRGLLVLPLTEDELAGVIGHEIIHANNRHSVKQQRSSVFGAILAMPGILIGGAVGGPIGQMAATPFLAGNQLLQSGYSRSYEREADDEGIILAAKAGYNPLDLAHFLARLQNESNYLSGIAAKKSYFDSHPFTPKRIKSITKDAEKLTVATHKFIVPPASFTSVFNGLLVGRNPKNGYIEKSAFYHPQHLFSVNLDTAKWQTAITPASFSLGSKDGGAIISLVCDADTLTSIEILSRFQKQMERQANLKPLKKENIVWNGYQGGVLKYNFEDQGQKGSFEIIVIDYRDGKTLKMSSIYKIENEAKVSAILKSANAIEKNDLPSTTIKQMMVVNAVEGESLTQAINRYNAEEMAELIAIINDKKLTDTLAKGEKVKIIVPAIFDFQTKK